MSFPDCYVCVQEGWCEETHKVKERSLFLPTVKYSVVKSDLIRSEEATLRYFLFSLTLDWNYLSQRLFPYLQSLSYMLEAD